MLQRLIPVLVAMLLTVSSAAQEQAATGGLNIPEPARQSAVAPWVAMVTLLVLLVIVGAASFKSAKRSHQD